MSKALLAISTAALRETPFFVIEGPEGRRLACQWESFVLGRAQGTEFEILCPETPEAMGCLSGAFEDGEFRMRPAVRRIGIAAHAPAPELDLDPEWRGDLNCVLDSGWDWESAPDGTLRIHDPEEPAADPDDDASLRTAA